MFLQTVGRRCLALQRTRVQRPFTTVRFFSSSEAGAEPTAETAVPETKVAADETPKVVAPKFVHVLDVLGYMRSEKQRKFDETVDIEVRTGLDPRKPDQSIRSAVTLPKNLGKKIRVAVFAEGEEAQAARDAGADIVGSDDLIETVKSGEIEFERCVATPAMMRKIGMLGRQLGPKGLMPNAKTGTVTNEITKAVQVAKAGQVHFKTDKLGAVRAGVAKMSWTDEEILENMRAFMMSVQQNKPSGSKGKYLRAVYISKSMGDGYLIEPTSIDPASPRFMRQIVQS